VERLTLPSAAYITNAYDGQARLTDTWLKNGSHSTLNSHSYQLNDGHQRTKQTRTGGDFVDYTYDNIGQLTSGLGKESGGTTNRWNEQFRYTYDAAGNLSNRVQNVLTNVFAVNNLNELTAVVRTNTSLTVGGNCIGIATNVTVADNGNSPVAATRYADATFARTNVTVLNGTNTFTAVAKDADSRADTNSTVAYLPTAVTFLYDLNGNMRTNGSLVMAYDDENQLIAITNAGAWASTFAYDGKLRRRIRKEFTWRNSTWVLTNEVRYLYDGNLVVQDRNEFNVGTKTYTRGLDLSGSLQDAGGIGGLLAFSDHTSGNTYHIDFHADGNGNVTALVDRYQQVVARYLFDPFGTILASSGQMAELNPFRFSSKEAHTQSGLIYYGYRYYEPDLQRWVTSDPIGEPGDPNLFRFARNRINSAIDKWGLTDEDVNKILQESKDFTSIMTTIGQRYNGSGAINNFLSTWQNLKNRVTKAISPIPVGVFPGLTTLPKPYLGCGEQADELGSCLCSTTMEDTWTFSIFSFLEPGPHQILIAKSSNPTDPILYLDPWNNKFGKKPPAIFCRTRAPVTVGTSLPDPH
jgi:RHS repeat-associated protein